ncbi:tRNA-dihydrouridine(16/17) synthase [NAD(P)(+)]-like protein [Terramyces sp. JEL0728]|nr:tRNA-dihydrouridine(16/17) synthase [NAD(P)(+)]-like protein [Terramyces sp. JEL0728]
MEREYKLAVPTRQQPNVYKFGVPYNVMYNDLFRKDVRLYTQNGILNMLDRNRKVKLAPEKFQDSQDQFEIVITCEERVFDAALEDILNKGTIFKKPVHVINVDIIDNREQALIGGQLILQLVEMLGGYELYKSLGSPKHLVAPMVEQSELAWRLLSRKYNAHLTYTPMFHAKLFSENQKYRQENWIYNEADQPLVVQFCANDPQYFLSAAKLVQEFACAVDLNLGCPQGIAKRGHYGAFLMDDWDTISAIVKLAHQELDIPITCKIRIYPELEKTIRYAKMLQDSGCQMLTVHGRFREQKGQMTGIADWKQIAELKKVLSIPVFANGNIMYNEDIEKCVQDTGVDGIMSAEGSLYNPAIFQPVQYSSWYLAEEYLDVIKQYPYSADFAQAKAHLFKIFHAALPIYIEMRGKLATVRSMDEVIEFTKEMKERLVNDYGSEHIFKGEYTTDDRGVRELPVWVVQPYIRKPLPVQNKEEQKRKTEVQPPSKKKVKQDKVICKQCPNVSSAKCTRGFCKSCCRKEGRDEADPCPTHFSTNINK